MPQLAVPAIGADAVFLDHRACAGAIDLDADNGVAGDPVAVVRAGTAHRRVVRTAGDMDSVAAIRDRCASRGIHTDPVAADHVVVGTLTVDLDAVLAISGDDVALGDERTTHRVGIGAALMLMPSTVLPRLSVPANIRANVVASDDVYPLTSASCEHDPVGAAGMTLRSPASLLPSASVPIRLPVTAPVVPPLKNKMPGPYCRPVCCHQRRGR